jgi:hypothetical protein
MKEDIPNLLNKLQADLGLIQSTFSSIPKDLSSPSYKKTYSYEDNFKLPSIRSRSHSITDHFQTSQERRIPHRHILTEQRARIQILNPQSIHGKAILQHRYNIPSSITTPKRNIGNIRFKKPKKSILSRPKVLPPEYRINPQVDPPPITEKDLEEGMFSLVNRGMIPKDVDLSPAFQRGMPPLQSKLVNMCDWRDGGSVVYNPPPPPVLTMQVQKHSPMISVESGMSSPAVPYLEEEQEARDYETLLDAHSAHTILIRKGKAVLNTPEAASYRRIFSEYWSEIVVGIREAEKVFTQYTIAIVYIDGKKLVETVKNELKVISLNQILDCVINYNQVAPYFNTALRYRTAIGKDLAAVRIQSRWRGYKAHTAYRQLRTLINKAEIIQTHYRLYRSLQHTRLIIQNKYQAKESIFRAIQQDFISRWPSMKTERRLEIHICSLRNDPTIEDLQTYQNSQIFRICMLRDENIDVIYVSAVPLSEEITRSYYQLLKESGVSKPEERLKFITPYNKIQLPKFLPTALLLYLSKSTVEELKEMVQDRFCYIVPGEITKHDICLSVALCVPIFMGDIEKSKYLSTKLGARELLERSEVPTAPGVVAPATIPEIYQKLAEIITEDLFMDTWILKINDEKRSRGMAYLEVSPIKLIKEWRKNYEDNQVRDSKELQAILEQTLPEIMHFVMPSMHKDYDSFFEKMVQKGGIIEATPPTHKTNVTTPSVSFVIEPSGEIYLIGTFDRIQSRDFQNSAVFFPQTSLEHSDIVEMIHKVAKTLYKEGVWGHVTVDLIAFPDLINEANKPLYWAVDLTLGMTNLAAAYLYFNLIVGGLQDLKSGKYYIPAIDEDERRPERTPWTLPLLPDDIEDMETPDYEDFNKYESRSYLYGWELKHPDLKAQESETFNNMCKYEGLDYDEYQSRGTIFLKYGDFSCEQIGLMTIGITRQEVIRYGSEAFTFILQHVGPPPQPLTSFYNQAVENRALSELVSKIKFIHKKLQQKHKAIKKSYIVEIV